MSDDAAASTPASDAAAPGPAARLRLLSFSTLYPNPGAPNHGVFVENRLRHLIKSGAASSIMLAPLPYFPGRASHSACPLEEQRHGITVLHPRFLAIPGLGLMTNPSLLARAAFKAASSLRARGAEFDVIDAHYLYPDGVAAIALGRRLGLPVVMTARGSDVTEFPNHAIARARILRAANEAAALISVSAGLKRALVDLGVAAEKITVLRNGVDLEQFSPQPREAARRKYGVTGLVLLSVGALITRKGHDRSIEALARLPEATLLIAGTGPERERLLALAERLDVASRLRLLGAIPHADLAELYSAADISLLASSREGWANVLLESLACGTPVVASPIPGNDEVINEAVAGRLACANTGEALAASVRDLSLHLPPRDLVRRFAEQFSWDQVSLGQAQLFRRILGREAASEGLVAA